MKNIVIIASCRSGHNFVRDQIDSWNMGDMIIHNLEDIEPENYQKAKTLINHDLKVTNVIVIRDLLNWWASYLKWISKAGIPRESHLNNAFRIWNAQVKEAFNETRYLKDKHIIKFDKFKRDQDLRIYHCNFLGGLWNEARLNNVVKAGGGSSFDGMNMIGKGNLMETDTRYKQIMKTELKELYLKMLKANKESVRLYINYFELTRYQNEVCELLI